MTLVKVRHGMARWREPRNDGRGGGYAIRTAFRGMTIDIPDSEAQRLVGENAVVFPDDELTRGGRMMPLPSGASNEELKAWVSVANSSEIDRACLDNPNIADRIRNARDLYEEELKAQNILQGGVPSAPDAGRLPAPLHVPAPTSEPQEEDGITNLTPDVPKIGDDQFVEMGDIDALEEEEGDPEVEDDADAEIEDEEPNEFDLDEVVHQSVSKVSEFLSEYPEQAAAILAAEERRAQEDDAKPDNVREGIIKAVTVAASHASQ